MIKRLSVFLAIAFMVVFCLSNSSLPSNFPATGNRSGVLGANTANCAGSGCHNMQGFGGYNLDIQITKPNDSPITKYNRDSVYKITLDANAVSEPGSFSKFGLQVSAKTKNGGIAGSFIPGGSLQENFSGGYPVLEQFQPLPATTPKRLIQSFYWIAPSNLQTQDVTFYATVLASNDDGTPNGDLSANRILTIQEEVVNAVPSELQFSPAQAYPNPFADVLRLRLPEGLRSVRVCLYREQGALVWSRVLENPASEMSLRFGESELANGVYVLVLTEGSHIVLKTSMVKAAY